MLLLCKVEGVETAIIGYAPGPVAIVPWTYPDGITRPRDVKFSEIELINLPDKLQRRLRRKSKKREKVIQFVPEITFPQ